VIVGTIAEYYSVAVGACCSVWLF